MKCETRLPVHFPNVRGNNGVPSTEAMASVMTAAGTPAPHPDTSPAQTNGAASELIINPGRGGFGGHGVLTQGANVISHWS